VKVKQANIFGLVFLGKVEIVLPTTQEKQRGKGDKKDIMCKGVKIISHCMALFFESKSGSNFFF
jgi:hypothetical protein